MPPPVEECPQLPVVLLLRDTSDKMDSKGEGGQGNVLPELRLEANDEDAKAVYCGAVPVDAVNWGVNSDEKVVGHHGDESLKDPHRLAKLGQPVVREGRQGEEEAGQAAPPVHTVVTRQVLQGEG